MATDSSDISLLFRIRADATGVKTGAAEAKAAVAQLRQSFGPELAQTVSLSNKAFSDLGNSLSQFVGQRIPLVGGAFTRLTDSIKGTVVASTAGDKAFAAVGKSIESIATASGKTVPQIASFLTNFVKLETQAKRDASAIEFFGASMATKLLPELEKTGTALAAVSAEGAAAGTAIGGMALPIGIAVVAIVGMTVAIAALSKEVFALAKSAAEFQGRLTDLNQQTGLSIETLSALEVLAKQVGAELGAVTQSVFLFQRKLDDAQDPLSKTAEQFRKFGVSINDTETSLRDAFAALAAMPDGFSQTNAAAEFFGARGGKIVLNILKEANGDIDGVIKRLREMGVLISTEQSRIADRFNDQLALLEFQLRALTAAAVEDLIPALTEMVRSFGDAVTALRPLASLLGSIGSTGLRPVAQAFKGLSLVVQLLTGDYKALTRAIKESREAQNIPPVTIPALTPVPLPEAPSARQTTTEAVNQADAVVASVKRAVAVQNQALDELFQKGRKNRAQQAEETIASNQRILEAEKSRIDALLSQKEQEIKDLDEAQRARGEIATRDTEQYRAITAEIGKLQQERLTQENLFDVTAREIRARAAKERADSQRNQIRNETDLLVGEFDRQIKAIEAQIALGTTEEESGLTIIEQIERAKIEARLDSQQRQKDIGFLTVQDQIDLNSELQKLQQEQDRLEDEQAARRLERERAVGQRAVDIALGNIDTLLQAEQIAGQRRIDTILALAEARVIAEEEAARQVLQVRLDLIDSEIEATQSKLDATSVIADKDERIRAQAELNNRLRILTEERTSIQATGEREVEDGRQRDLENERRYAEELQRIRERIDGIQRDAARTVIDLMEASFASRRSIIRAETELEIREANDRLRRNREDIRKEREVVNERIASLRGFLTALESSNQAELSAYAQITRARVDALTQQRNLNDQERAELEQHQALLAALRKRSVLGDFRSVIEARVRTLEQHRELNSAEQAELEQHQDILQALREREARASRVGVIEARIEVLQQQKSLNDEEQEELERHQEELQRIREQSGDLTFAIQRRVDFLNSQATLNTQERSELERHVAILQAISESGPSFEAVIRARIAFLEAQTTLNAEEQAELARHKAILATLEERSENYSNALQKRIEFLQQQKELNAEERAELERHEKELELIRRRARLAEKDADPVGRIDLNLDSLREFASILEDSIVPLGEILTRTFEQVADAIGQTVANWVLLGETGPAVMRKILAQALASIAAEAAVNAIKELALGFATLFFNPAESAAHFTAAGLWAAIGGVAAVAGRSVAGDLFKSKSGAGSGGASTSQGNGQLNPLTLQRNAGGSAPSQIAPQIQPVRVEISVKDSVFGKAITAHVVNDVNSAGPIREVLAGDGNLNRG